MIKKNNIYQYIFLHLTTCAIKYAQVIININKITIKYSYIKVINEN